MIRATLIGELVLAAPSEPGRLCRVSAASGLVVTESHLYVIADDELHLGVFPADGLSEGTLLRLFPGDLPEDKKARKARKPDLEVLTRLPAFSGFPSGALLALASGSRSNRRAGVAIALDAVGALVGEPRHIDLSPLYESLERRFPALNIEGAVAAGEQVRLLQRGSGKHPINACIDIQLTLVLDAIIGDGVVAAPESAVVHEVELGAIEGVSLCFTDAAALADGCIVFAAVAEAAKDSYEDGPCVGAAVGLLSADGNLQRLELLQPADKIEGLHAWQDGDAINLLLVTDPDDAGVPSRLLSAQMKDFPGSVTAESARS